MPPKGSTKRAAETTEAPASAEGLRRSTRGGGHKAPEPAPPKPASKPRSSKKAKVDDAEAGKDAPANGDAKPDAPVAEPTEPTPSGVPEGVPTEEAGVDVPEANKEAAEQVEKKQSKRIEVGEQIPEGIVLKNEKDEDVTIHELTKERGAIFFVYPKANTPGCTQQACSFRDNYSAFTELGYDVYGLSLDSPKSQASWKEKQSLPYHLLCDPAQVLTKLLGAAKAGSGKSNQRSHYIVAKGGKLVEAKYQVSPKDSTKLALEFAEKNKQE